MSAPSGGGPDGSRRLTSYDFVALAFSSIGLAGALVLSLVIAPVFTKMFSDFGGELPLLTSLCLRGWFLPLLSLVPFVVVIAGVIRRAPERSRARGMWLAVGWVFALQLVFQVAAALPLSAIASALQ